MLVKCSIANEKQGASRRSWPSSFLTRRRGEPLDKAHEPLPVLEFYQKENRSHFKAIAARLIKFAAFLENI
jgi:hypothetical protein